MSKLSRATISLLVWIPAVLALTNASAQQAASQQQPANQQSTNLQMAGQPAGARTQTTGRVTLDVVVTGKDGKPVTGLTQQDFKLLDNGQERPIVSFHGYSATAQAPHPTQIAIVVDSINMTYEHNAQGRVGIQRFLHQNGGHLAYPTSIYVVDDSGIRGRFQPTTDGNALSKNLDQMPSQLRTVTPSTGGWGEIEKYQASLRAVQAIVLNLAKQPGRNLLLWVGPSWPLMDQMKIQPSSGHGMEPLFQQIVGFSNQFRNDQIAFYSISLGNPDPLNTLYFDYVKPARKAGQSYPGDLNGKVFAVETGGLVLGPNQDLTPQIETSVQDASAYYRIAFDAPRADGKDEYHELKVPIDKPGLTARTTTGYYDEP